MSIEDQLKNGTVYTMKQTDVHNCPHYIMMPNHYRDDGTCKCNELGHQDMLAWGYVWNGKSWIVPE